MRLAVYRPHLAGWEVLVLSDPQELFYIQQRNVMERRVAARVADDRDLAPGKGTRVLEGADENIQIIFDSSLQNMQLGKNTNCTICCLNHETQLEVMLKSVMNLPLKVLHRRKASRIRACRTSVSRQAAQLRSGTGLYVKLLEGKGTITSHLSVSFPHPAQLRDEEWGNFSARGQSFSLKGLGLVVSLCP